MADDPNEELFLELSSVLTGVAVSNFDRAQGRPAKIGDLEPKNSPIRLGPEYLKILQGWKGGTGIKNLLKEVADNAPPRNSAEAARRWMVDPELGPICQSIIKLWYLGVWYPPDDRFNPKKVVSSQAYVEGLVWKVMQAHPMGYSMGYFGYWSETPAPLEEFVSVRK